MVKEVTHYSTHDGKIFDKFQDAMLHEQLIGEDMQVLLNDYFTSVCSGITDTRTKELLIERAIDNIGNLITIINIINNKNAQLPKHT